MPLPSFPTTLDSLPATSPVVLLSTASAGLALLGLFKFFQPSRSRNYVDKGSVGDEYDKWADDGVLEKFWG